MMFLRFLILIGIFRIGALTAIYPYLLIMSAVAAGTAWFLRFQVEASCHVGNGR